VNIAPGEIDRPAGTPQDDLLAAPARVARSTVDLPGLGGRIRQVPEDFRVEEIPLYEPAGEGDHVLFQVEKTGISTFEALLWISKTAKVSEHAIGYAGLKDAHAVTRQSLSVHRVPPERLLALRHPRIRVLSAVRRPTKIRIGHLRGNRFTIRIRGADLSRLKAARTALGLLCERGVPNAYGVQRFGVKLDGHLLGRALVHGDFGEFLSHLCGRPHPREGDPRVLVARRAYDRGDVRQAFEAFPMKHRVQKKALSALLRTGDPRAAFEALGRRPRRIYVSAYQSWLFNRCLDARVVAGTHDRLLRGDLAWLHPSGALYPVGDAEA
jgi:tRNA pseudouridine13 synthase